MEFLRSHRLLEDVKAIHRPAQLQSIATFCSSMLRSEEVVRNTIPLRILRPQACAIPDRSTSFTDQYLLKLSALECRLAASGVSAALPSVVARSFCGRAPHTDSIVRREVHGELSLVVGLTVKESRERSTPGRARNFTVANRVGKRQTGPAGDLAIVLRG